MKRVNSGIVLMLLVNAQTVFGSAISIGPNGINSAGLGLTGDAITIGQVEPARPGDAGTDAAANRHTAVDPTAVFRRNGAPNIADVSSHAENVAGIMISTDTGALAGVAPEADLYSSAYVTSGVAGYHDALLTTLHLIAEGSVQTINHSWGKPLDTGAVLDGNSLVTSGFDWSAREEDVLHVVGGNEGTMIPVPTDNFNGMTISYSSQEAGVYRRVAAGNTFDEDAEGNRTSTSLLAPGQNIEMTDLGSTATTPPHPAGTSFAAPHVTGTVALLHEYAETQMTGPTPNPRFDADSRRHQVMKSVLMNSADKIIDDGTFILPGETTPVPAGRLLGMERTVLKQPQPGNPNPTWFDSDAYNDALEEQGSFIPLDLEMGTGHLNASRALTQFTSGEYENDAQDVPEVGWDYGSTTAVDDINRYRFFDELRGGSFISVTLSWDREVELDVDTAPLGVYNFGDTFTQANPDVGIDPQADRYRPVSSVKVPG